MRIISSWLRVSTRLLFRLKYTLIERIDLFPERQENGSILKRIRFKFRVDYDAEAGGKVLLNENDVDTVVLMTRVNTNK